MAAISKPGLQAHQGAYERSGHLRRAKSLLARGDEEGGVRLFQHRSPLTSLLRDESQALSRPEPYFSRNRRRHARHLGVACALLVSSGLADAPVFAAENDGPDAGETRRGVAAELSYDSIAGDGFLGLRLKLGYAFDVPQVFCDEVGEGACRSELRVGLQAPLR